ncbi:endo-b1,4-mannanase 5C [Klebsiella pneumoniae]|nr:endo-b1,4-mannanase 5C [Klebsiella pneumoniae]
MLRETTSPFAINWMGAAVGRSYDVERAASPTGPWTVVGRDISDGVNEWNPEPWFCSATIIVSFSSGTRITTG